VKRDRDRAKLENLINPRGRLTFGIDASPLFSREDYWQRQSLLKKIRSVGVPAFGILHSIEVFPFRNGLFQLRYLWEPETTEQQYNIQYQCSHEP
jgi:hypothetical protein